MARGAARQRADWRTGFAGAVVGLFRRIAALRLASASVTGIRQLHMMVALIAPLLMLLTIAFMAQQQNVDALHREQARAVTLQRYLLQQAALLGLDNARWNDAYRSTVLDLDRVWMDENWGPDAFGTMDYHDAFLVDEGGATRYASLLGERSARPAEALLGSRLAALLDRARAPDSDGSASGFVPYLGGVAVASLNRIRPVDATLVDPAAPTRYLVMVKRFDAAVLRELQLPSGFVRLSVGGTRHGETAVPFVGIDGKPFAWLTWASRSPGYSSALAVMPVALLLFVLLAYAGLVGARTARRWAEQVLANEASARRLAELDPLTELPNRRAFIERLHADLDAERPVSIVYVDLDGFKAINDAFGHITGDMLLVAAAERIALAAANDTASHMARLGGDEFAIALIGADAELRGQRVAIGILSGFAHPIQHAGRQVYLGASIGVASSAPGLGALELVRHADVAMYAAKAAGRRQWRAYDPVMDAGRDIRQQLAVELRAALQNDAIDVCYQPIVDARSERIVACEALARWTSPTRGAIEPGLFISVAEEAGLISELTRQVLRKAARAATRWDICVAVNLSAAEAWDTRFADSLLAILAEAGLPPARLELEITEGYLLREADTAREVLSELRTLGVQVALDDFGTGFASLTYLRKLPLDRLKLTHEFLAEIVGEGRSRPLAAAIVQLGDALGLPVTAEGVETREQAALLRDAGCTRLQGWLYGKPMSAAHLTRRLKQREAA
jgi:diguanylate cyclase (GGDEF)-like protein